ncbi:hypothetical protein H311_02755 [Anncaliia algerae PRA109]|nr:hypothetical protein H311_02755 [Anncaliia algerae PRA109]UGN72703.1 RBLL-2 [Anncaliia algerae]
MTLTKYIIILSLFINYSISFVIQERSTGRYLSSKNMGVVALVEDIRQASPYIIRAVGNSPIDMAITDKKSKLALDFAADGPDLISYSYSSSTNQLFKLNLDENGYWQIIQGTEKYLYYDPETSKLKGGPYDVSKTVGFMLFADDGIGPFPVMKGAKLPSPIPPVYPEAPLLPENEASFAPK